MHKRKGEDTLKDRQAMYAANLLGKSAKKIQQQVEQLSSNQRIEFKRALRKHMQFDDQERREADLKRLLRVGFENQLARLYTKTLLEHIPQAMKNADEYIRHTNEILKESWRRR